MISADFLSLKLFVAVAEEGNMSKAAAREHIALAALSKRITKLEDKLGIALLVRERQGVKLTAAGSAFLQHAREVLYAVQRMTVELGDYAKGIRGYVRVAASTSAMMQFLPEDLRDFLQRNPSIRIDLQQRASMDAARFVQDGVADIGIFSSAIPAAELQAFPYRTDTLVVIVPENHPLTQRKAVRFRELLQYDFIELEEGSAIHALLTREAALLGKYLKVRVRVRSFDVLCRMIQNGIGVGVLPEASAAMYMAAMELRKVRLDESWAHREVQLYVRNTDALTPSARQLLQFLSRSASPGIEGSERMDSADSDGTETAPTAGSAQRKR